MEKSGIRVESCQSTTLSPICLLVTPRALQFFFFIGILILLPAARLNGALSIGAAYSIGFVDIDGNKHSTANGHVTVIVLATPAEREKARTVGDRVPERCLGNPDYRMITIVRFVRKHTVVGRRIATAFIRPDMTERRLHAMHGKTFSLRLTLMDPYRRSLVRRKEQRIFAFLYLAERAN